MTTTTHWLLAFAITLLLGLSWQLDGPTDHDAEQASAAALSDAREHARAEFIAQARAGAHAAREVPTRYASAEDAR